MFWITWSHFETVTWIFVNYMVTHTHTHTHILFKIKNHTTLTTSLHAKPNGLLKTNATNLKSWSITSSLVHLPPSAMVVHLVLVQSVGVGSPKAQPIGQQTTLHMKSLTFKKSLFNKKSNTKPKFSKFPIIVPQEFFLASTPSLKWA